MASPSEYLVFSASLRPASNSRVMAEQIIRDYASLNVTAALVDLRDYPLPFCDGDAAYAHPAVDPLTALIQQARVIIIAAPIYNYDANAAIKNLVELTGSAWEDKIVGFFCAAGGTASYMSIMSLANSLMLDFRCLIIPRFVYATGDDFEYGQVASESLRQRIKQLADTSLRIRNG
jgi:FMN reductase